MYNSARISSYLTSDVPVMTELEAETFLSTYVNLTRIADGMNVTSVEALACDVNLLSKYIGTSDAEALEKLSQTLCNMTDQGQQNIEHKLEFRVLRFEIAASRLLLQWNAFFPWHFSMCRQICPQ